MAKRSSRSVEKEAFWRFHLDRQSSLGVSIRSYCHQHDLSEPSFHFWRREIAKRDAEQKSTRRRPRTSRAVPLTVPDCSRSTETGGAGLIAVEIVGETLLPSTARPTLEIECPGGPVIRLREDVSLEVLQRVMVACQQVPAEGVSKPAQVRSC